MFKLNFKTFLLTVLWMLFVMLITEELMAQTPAVLNKECTPNAPTIYGSVQIPQRTLVPEDCNPIKEARMYATVPVKEFTYQVFAGRRFSEAFGEEKPLKCKYIEIYNEEQDLWFVYVYPPEFLYFTPEQIQLKITEDGVCTWLETTITTHKYKNAFINFNPNETAHY
jgi:hypothetical protein